MIIGNLSEDGYLIASDEELPDLVREILAGGHEIGHHGYTHTSPSKLTPAEEEAVRAFADVHHLPPLVHLAAAGLPGGGQDSARPRGSADREGGPRAGRTRSRARSHAE